MRGIIVSVLAFAAFGCSSLSVDNQEATPPQIAASTPIRWHVQPDCLGPARQDPWHTREDLARACPDPAVRDLITIAISGGGAKAALFGGETLFYMQALGLLQQASVLSTVSGGSFAGAIYALSCDEGDIACIEARPHGRARPLWQYAPVMRTLGQGYSTLITEQTVRAFVPVVPSSISAGRFAQVIDRDYFQGGTGDGQPFRFADLNPKRPHLFLNATIVSENRAGLGSQPPNNLCLPLTKRGYLRRRTPDEFFHFAFSDYYFGLVRSEVSGYPLASGVATSAAFPALIDQAVLHDYCGEKGKTDLIRLMDGGANDNQALIEIYMILTELIYGQHRSDLYLHSGALEALSPSDRAFVLVVNSAVTESTGEAASGETRQPHGTLGLLSGAVKKALTAIDVYSAEGYNLRKQSYLTQNALLQGQGRAPVIPVEFSLTALDQYYLGGTEAALRIKAGVATEEKSDIFQRLSNLRAARQRRAYEAIVPKAEVRHRLGLSDIHPQCYFDLRKELDASLVSLSDEDQDCLREAARWAAALRAQEMCDPADPFMRTPDGLACSDINGERVVSLRYPDVLVEPGKLPSRCRRRVESLMSRRALGPGDEPRVICQPL